MAETKELNNFYYISLTDKGPVRTKNEDYLGYFNTVNGHVFVVCDGVGGLPCGDKASQTVVNSIKFFFSNYYYRDIKTAMKDAIDYAQTRMIEEAKENSQCAGMGSTIVLAIFRDNKIYYAHMGDSRIYYIHNRKMIRLTEDDSYVQQLVDQGKLTQKQAENHPRKNELVRVMGMNPTCEPHICPTPIMPRESDLLLLCTDGLYNMVNEKNIQATLSHRGYIEDKGMELLNTAIKNGGSDNISLQLIKFYNISQPNTKFKKSSLSFVNSKNRLPLIVAAIVSIILLTIAIKYLRHNKPEQHSQNQTSYTKEYVKIDITNNSMPDTLLKLYNVNKEDVYYRITDDATTIEIPVKKIHTVRYYDNLQVLEKLYNTKAEAIEHANAINNKRLVPGQQINIPY